MQYFRNIQFRSILRCTFPFIRNAPIVLLVKFYITPNENQNISPENLKKECIPATQPYEIADYLLSFMEMLKDVLFSSYLQIVKVDASKFYSKKPRTSFKFLTWNDYVKLQDNDTLHTQAQSIRTSSKRKSIQPKPKGDASNGELRKEAPATNEWKPDVGTSIGDYTLSNPSEKLLQRRKKKTARLKTAYSAT